eukprot:4086069-Pyramimonas_sp.AAC.1
MCNRLLHECTVGAPHVSSLLPCVAASSASARSTYVKYAAGFVLAGIPVGTSNFVHSVLQEAVKSSQDLADWHLRDPVKI